MSRADTGRDFPTPGEVRPEQRQQIEAARQAADASERAFRTGRLVGAPGGGSPALAVRFYQQGGVVRLRAEWGTVGGLAVPETRDRVAMEADFAEWPREYEAFRSLHRP